MKFFEVDYEDDYEDKDFVINQRCFENKACQLGEKIIDIGCQLTGIKCGINMVLSPTSIAINNQCVQYCVCDIEFMVEGNKCAKRNTFKTTSSTEYQNITQERTEENVSLIF